MSVEEGAIDNLNTHWHHEFCRVGTEFSDVAYDPSCCPSTGRSRRSTGPPSSDQDAFRLLFRRHSAQVRSRVHPLLSPAILRKVSLQDEDRGEGTFGRAGKWQEAVGSLEKSMELGSDDAYDWLFLSMAHRRLGRPEDARRWFDKAAAWMTEHRPDDRELLRFRAEAEELMRE